MSYYGISMNANMCTYDYFLQEDVCRLCWSKKAERDVTKTSEERGEIENGLADKIRDCLNLDFKKDSFPRKACDTCSSKVEDFYEYKRFCRETERRLQDIIGHFESCSASFTCEIKTEQSTDNDFKLDSLDNCVVKDLQSYDSLVVNETDLITKKSSKIKQKKTSCLLQNVDDYSLSDSWDDANEYRSAESLIEKRITKKVKKIKKVTARCVPNIKCVTDNGVLHNGAFLAKKVLTRNQIKNQKNNKKTYKQKRSPTYCNICRIDLGSIEQMTSHNASNHGIENGSSFKCFGCEKRFKNRKARLSHELNFCKGLKDGYKCIKCNRFLPRRSMYETHMRDHRENTTVELPENLFQCSKCCKLFKTNMNLKEHMIAHDSVKKNYVCESCGRVFTRQDYLQKHRLTHSGTKHLSCPHCKYRTSQRSSLIIHIRIHTGERPYTCDLCPLRCISSSNLLAHRRRHLGHKAFECSICNKKFGYKNSLEEHIASVHEGSNSFSCNICAAVYTRARGLRRHLQAKHGKHKVDSHPPTDGASQDISCEEQPRDGASRQKSDDTSNEFLKIIEGKDVDKGNEVFQICY